MHRGAALAQLLALLAAVAAAPRATSARKFIRVNAGGPAVRSLVFGGDAFFSARSAPFKAPRAVAARSWAAVYATHRWATAGDLRYDVPAPADGVYDVELLFAETWPVARVGTRVFRVFVNEALVTRAAATNITDGLDVFAAAGPFRGLVVRVPSVFAPSGTVTVRLQRIKGRNNPFISGIVLRTL